MHLLYPAPAGNSRAVHSNLGGLLLGVSLLLTPLGCSRTETPGRSSAPGRATPVPTLQFREDGYDAARAEAERRGVPLFVDVWASWCHTCMSMKEYVLPDPVLGKLAAGFVWLSLDSERRESVPFMDRFKSSSLPTLWVIDPASQKPLLKWIGAATAPELAALLEDVLRERSSDPAQLTSGAGTATAQWLRGNRASAAGQTGEAIDLYRGALALAKPGWDKRPLALEALSMRLYEAGRHDEELELAAREAKSMPKGTSLVNVILNGISAGSELPRDATRQAQLNALVALGVQAVHDADLPVLVDDRSSLYETLVEALKSTDAPRAKQLASDWLDLLDAQATQAKTPEARRVWDAHRLAAYLALEQPGRAIPMLEQSEREQPTDYNPPARLARAYLALAQLKAARAAIDRALARCDGPRKLRLYMLKADVLLAQSDRKGARAVLDEALDFARSGKLPAQYEKQRLVIERRALDLS